MCFLYFLRPQWKITQLFKMCFFFVVSVSFWTWIVVVRKLWSKRKTLKRKKKLSKKWIWKLHFLEFLKGWRVNSARLINGDGVTVSFINHIISDRTLNLAKHEFSDPECSYNVKNAFWWDSGKAVLFISLFWSAKDIINTRELQKAATSNNWHWWINGLLAIWRREEEILGVNSEQWKFQ